MKLDLLTNATVVNDAMKFVSDYSNNNSRNLSYKKGSSQESKEGPDYDDKEDWDKQGEEKQEEATGESNKEQELEQKITINQVF
jgi:hypothetical protein